MSKFNYDKLLNLGMADPLTLGMASPLADRIEILGRSRPLTNRSRMMAGAVLLGLAAISAPLTIADAHPEHDTETKSKTVIAFSDGDIWSKDGTARLKEGKSFEIITEDGVTTAYRISNGGKTREAVDVEALGSENYRIILKDGEVVTFERPDRPDLKALRGLKSLEALKNLESLSSLSALSKLEKLKSLESLSDPELQRFFKDKGITIDLEDRAIFFDGPEGEREASSENLRERIQEAVRGNKDLRKLRIDQFSDRFEFPPSPAAPASPTIVIPDTVVGFRADNIRRDHAFRRAEIQLEQAARQIERMSENQEASKSLEQAMKDLAKAKASLEKAKQEMRTED